MKKKKKVPTITPRRTKDIVPFTTGAARWKMIPIFYDSGAATVMGVAILIDTLTDKNLLNDRDVPGIHHGR